MEVDKILNILSKFFDRTQKSSKFLHLCNKIEDKSFSKYFKGKNLRILSRGLLTGEFYKKNKDWNYPFWIRKQTDPNSKFFFPLSYDPLLVNKTFRNWTILSVAGFDKKCIIDLTGNITVGKDSFSISIGFIDQEKLITADNIDGVKLSYICDDNSFKIDYKGYGTQIIETFWKNNIYYINSKLDFKNFMVLIRPFNPEGVAPISSIKIKKNYVYVNEQKVLEIPGLTKAFLSKYKNGDIINLLNNKEVSPSKEIIDKNGFCTAAIESEGDSFAIFPIKHKKILTLKKYYFNWDKKFAFSLNDKDFDRIYRTQKNYLSSFLGKKRVVSGAFTDNELRIEDYVSLISAIDRLGIENDYIFKINYKKLSIIELSKYAWTLMNHYALTKNEKERTKTIIYEILNTIKTTRDKNDNFLLSQPNSKDKIKNFGKYMETDLWALSANKLAFNLFKDERIKRDYLSYLAIIKKEIDNYCQKNSKRRFLKNDIFHMPLLLYPEILYNNKDSLITDTVNKIKEKYLKNGVLYNPEIEGYDILNTIKFFHILLILEDKDTLSLFYNIFKFASTTQSFPKAVNPLTLGGSFGDGHYSPITAEIINFIASIFGYDKIDKELHIFKVSKIEWFDNDVEVHNLRTMYGTVNYCLKLLDKDEYVFNIDPMDAEIYLHLPFPFIINDSSSINNYIKLESGETEVRFRRYEKE